MDLPNTLKSGLLHDCVPVNHHINPFVDTESWLDTTFLVHMCKGWKVMMFRF